MKSDIIYILKKKSTHNIVYICEGSRYIDGKGSRQSLFVSMCGYGPAGRWSLNRRYRTKTMLKDELSLFWKHPSRKKEIDDLVVERYNRTTGEHTFPPMKRLLREVEQELLLRKLKGE